MYCNIALLSAVYRVEASGRDEEYKTLRAIQDRHCITLLPFKVQLTVLKQPAQMRMMEAMVVETNNWGPFKIYNDNWIIANNVFSAILPTSNLSDQCCEQVPKAAPKQHGGNKVGGGEEARGDDAGNLMLMTLSEDLILEEVIKAKELAMIVASIEITLSACISKSFLWFQ